MIFPSQTMPVKIKHRSKQANALRGPISMQQVAVHAGVSRSAVSLALQHHPSIPASTRERIRAAAQELGYRPNPLVTALMRVVSVKFCKKGIGGMWLDEIKRFMGRVKGGGEATSLSWVSGLS